jgi:hypothetical protein
MNKSQVWLLYLVHFHIFIHPLVFISLDTLTTYTPRSKYRCMTLPYVQKISNYTLPEKTQVHLFYLILVSAPVLTGTGSGFCQAAGSRVAPNTGSFRDFESPTNIISNSVLLFHPLTHGPSQASIASTTHPNSRAPYKRVVLIYLVAFGMWSPWKARLNVER